jgi:hypothetical protein
LGDACPRECLGASEFGVKVLGYSRKGNLAVWVLFLIDAFGFSGLLGMVPKPSLLFVRDINA